MYRALEAAWAKYNRASKDLKLLHDNCARFLERQPYRVDVELDSSSGWWVARTRIVEDPPPVFGVLVGSLAHQLYSALNHVTYALGVQHLGEDEAHKKRMHLDFPITEDDFPITEDPNAFKRCKVLKHVSSPVAEIFEELQPYHREPGGHGRIEHPLLLVKEIANADKHRVLPASYGAIELRPVLSGEAFVWDRNIAPTGEFERVLPPSDEVIALASGTDLARIRFDARNLEAGLRVDPQPDVDIVFESDTWGGLTLHAIGNCAATVDRCISKLAPRLPDESWPPNTHDPLSPYDW